MRVISYILFSVAILFSMWFGWQLFDQSRTLNTYKADFAKINEVKYGLFNLERWKSGLAQIFEDKIKEFEFSEDSYDGLQLEIEKFLDQLYDEYFASGDVLDGVLDQASENSNMVNQLFITMLKKNIGNQLKNMDFKGNLPVVAEKLVDELKRKSPEIKKVFADQLQSLMDSATYLALEEERRVIYSKYEEKSLEKSNLVLKELIEEGNLVQKRNILYTILSLIASLLIALVLKNYLKFRELILMLSISSIVFLALGVSLPMIDLDARLNAIKFKIFGSEISFDEQILYYQSKSIIDVTETLLQGKGFDLKFVGILILMFSIVFPFTKLIVSTLFLYKEKIRTSKLAQTIIYYFGKWSMADVFTVAIFMSYIGFYGLLNTQLSQISADSNSYAIDTVNYSKLSPGFIFFTSYCILSIIVGIIIQRSQKKSFAEY